MTALISRLSVGFNLFLRRQQKYLRTEKKSQDI